MNMSERIEEKTLILPALYIIKSLGSATTSEIKNELVSVFKPSGEDAKLLAGRKDTKFTQIVRNLMGSHYETNKMCNYTTKSSMGRYGKFSLTEEGETYLSKNIDAIKYLFENDFSYSDVQNVINAIEASNHKKKKVIIYNENDMVSEGRIIKKETAVKKRSKKLRDAALSYYMQEDGSIKCCVCNFDFKEFYGDIGEAFIHIHHEEPIYQYSDDGFEGYISDAIKKMKPVCANCHCMLHRKSDVTLSIKQLRDLIKAESPCIK